MHLPSRNLWSLSIFQFSFILATVLQLMTFSARLCLQHVTVTVVGRKIIDTMIDASHALPFTVEVLRPNWTDTEIGLNS